MLELVYQLVIDVCGSCAIALLVDRSRGPSLILN